MKEKIDKNTNTFTAGQVGTILERVESQVKTIAEGQMILTQKVDAITATVGMTLERLTMVEMKVTILDTKVTALDSRVASLEKTTQKIQADTTEIKNMLAGHEQRLTHLEALK